MGRIQVELLDIIYVEYPDLHDLNICNGRRERARGK